MMIDDVEHGDEEYYDEKWLYQWSMMMVVWWRQWWLITMITMIDGHGHGAAADADHDDHHDW